MSGEQSFGWKAWFSFASKSFLVLISTAFALYFLHVRLEELYPEAGRTALQKVMVSLPEEAAIACLVAFFIALAFEYFVQQRHASDAELLHRKLEAERKALFDKLEAERRSLFDKLEAERNSVFSKLEAERNSLLEVAKENLVTGIYKRKIPASIYNHVESFLLRSRFVRKSYSVILEFTMHTTATGERRTDIAVEQSYQIHNVSDEGATYHVKAVISTDPRQAGEEEESQFRLVEIQPHSASGARVGERICLQHANIIKDGNYKKNGTDQSFSREVTIQQGEFVSVKVCHRGIYALDGADVICCMNPADGMDVTAYVPNRDYSVELVSMHPDDAVPETVADPERRRRWHLKRAIFPGQGVCFQWYPRKPVALLSSAMQKSDEGTMPETSVPAQNFTEVPSPREENDRA